MCGSTPDRVVLELEGGVFALGTLKNDSNGSIELEKAVLVANGVPIRLLSLCIKKAHVKEMREVKPMREENGTREALLSLIEGFDEIVENLFDEESWEELKERIKRL